MEAAPVATKSPLVTDTAPGVMRLSQLSVPELKSTACMSISRDAVAMRGLEERDELTVGVALDVAVVVAVVLEDAVMLAVSEMDIVDVPVKVMESVGDCEATCVADGDAELVEVTLTELVEEAVVVAVAVPDCVEVDVGVGVGLGKYDVKSAW